MAKRPVHAGKHRSDAIEIFDFRDYKEYVRRWVQRQPRNGYGQFRRIAEALRMNSVVVSQTFNGTRDLTLDQAYRLADFLSLRPLEREFLLLLVARERAASHEYKGYLDERIQETRTRAQNLKERIPSEHPLPAAALARFHSSWSYSAVRLATSIDRLVAPEAIAERVGLPVLETKAILEFLLSVGLCVQENGRVRMGPKRTHLSDDSPYIVGRQLSWRAKAFERMPRKTPEELFYTSPMALSRKDLARVRAELVRVIESVAEIVEPSVSEELACLNIDWFKV